VATPVVVHRRPNRPLSEDVIGPSRSPPHASQEPIRGSGAGRPGPAPPDRAFVAGRSVSPAPSGVAV